MLQSRIAEILFSINDSDILPFGIHSLIWAFPNQMLPTSRDVAKAIERQTVLQVIVPVADDILVITLFHEDNIFGTNAILTYGPQLQMKTCH